ncbi:MAG: helix-turn-helix domain-containing protein [Tannerellaceae bacterium]|jgi:transcriptional regulator with XRE-family HTH domain|nr:helix-turn-helix domain-containing protein [Tannerellaceae bacterium]
MKNRILQVMQREGLTPAKFAAAIDIQRSAVSHITTGRNNPSLDVIMKILEKYPYIDPDWLIYGKGNMMRKNTPPVQTDLFSLAPLITPKVTAAPENRREIKAEKPVVTIKQPVQEPVIVKKNESKNVTKIMLFYSDNTFETFIPEKINKD